MSIRRDRHVLQRSTVPAGPVRVRWRDIDFDRNRINVWQGKGRSDRQVTLPECYRPLLRQLSEGFRGEDFIFPGERQGRHLSPRTAQRIMERAVRVAGIKKKATPHSLHRSFAVGENARVARERSSA